MITTADIRYVKNLFIVEYYHYIWHALLKCGGNMNRLEEYISQSGGKISMDMAYAISSLSLVEEHSPVAAEAVVKELRDQRHNLKLIASENYSSLSVQAAMGSLLTDKYSEGFPGHRFYSGCDNVP